MCRDGFNSFFEGFYLVVYFEKFESFILYLSFFCFNFLVYKGLDF